MLARNAAGFQLVLLASLGGTLKRIPRGDFMVTAFNTFKCFFKCCVYSLLNVFARWGDSG